MTGIFDCSTVTPLKMGDKQVFLLRKHITVKGSDPLLIFANASDFKCHCRPWVWDREQYVKTI